MDDEDVTSKSGIYDYVLMGNERMLCKNYNHMKSDA